MQELIGTVRVGTGGRAIHPALAGRYWKRCNALKPHCTCILKGFLTTSHMLLTFQRRAPVQMGLLQ